MRLRAGGLTAIDGLGAERIRGYKQTAGGCMQTAFRKCADNGKGGGRDVQAENAQRRIDGDREDAARGWGVCKHRKDTYIQQPGSAQPAVSKGDETDRLRTYSSRMIAIESKGSRSERLRG